MRALGGLREGQWGETIEVAPYGNSNSVSLLPQEKQKDQWYDLNGRKISVPYRPGIYIHNGRKVLR